MQLIHDDLQQATPADRLQYRYVVNDTLHNSRRVSQSALQQSHIGFVKLLNSVNWNAQIIRPLPLGDEQVVFRVDLRQIHHADSKHWSAEDWLNLTAEYPYGLALSFTEGSLGAQAAEVYEWTGTRIPAVRLDWFVQTASRPKLYHRLLGIPATRQELEESLGVQSDRLIGDQVVHVRGGVRQSPVGDSGRVLARFETRFGYYWISYDFLRDTRVTDFVVRPLGPVSENHPFLEHAFVEAGGEIIFSLPNGLQGYMLCDRIGRRLDVAPTSIVQDRVLQASGGAEVFNGISCIACHEKGMQNFRDIVRQTSRLTDKTANDLVQQMYRPQAELDGVLARDSQRFVPPTPS